MFNADCGLCFSEKVEEMSMSTDAGSILRKAEMLNFPFVIFGGSLHLNGEQQWRRDLPCVPRGHLDTIASQLDEHATQQRRQMAFEDREAEIDARREASAAPQTVEEQAQREEMLAEANALAARAEMPATRAQLQRLIGFMEDLRAVLNKR